MIHLIQPGTCESTCLMLKLGMSEMPEICRFLGIVIKMFYEDHNPLIFMLCMVIMRQHFLPTP